jgi:hypothetical protein
MKKKDLISFIVIYLLTTFAILFSGCRKVEVIPTPQPTTTDIFSKSEVSVKDGQDIQFKLTSAGKYILTLMDSTQTQVVTKEKFNGIVGDNIKKIYTKSLSQKTLYLYLTDESNKEIGKTKITIN